MACQFRRKGDTMFSRAALEPGLGEIGRMGLPMAPRQGPRVRLAVLTCDLPLPPMLPLRPSRHLAAPARALAARPLPARPAGRAPG
ncbi:MAG: hypothetical protein R3D98_15515 [Candidatus Krumholzibacteriia bacterium]